MASIQLSDLPASSLHPFAEGARKQRRTESHEPFELMPTERRASQLAKNSRWNQRDGFSMEVRARLSMGVGHLFSDGKADGGDRSSQVGEMRGWPPHDRVILVVFKASRCGKEPQCVCVFDRKTFLPNPLVLFGSGRKRGDFLIVFNQGGAAVDILCWNYRTLLYQQLQGLLTLFSEFFSSFPCGTCTLSISHCVFSLGRSIPPD